MANTKITLILFFVFCMIEGISQTPTLAHKSRSNPSEINQELDHNYSNFGIAPNRYVIAAKLDSLIFLNDSLTIMVTSKGHISIPYRRDTSDYSSHKEMGKWSPGRDTVKNHPIFNLQKPEIEIRVIIEEDYNFINSADSIVFVYYKAPLTRKQVRKQKKKKKSFLPIWIKQNPGSLFILLILSLLAFQFASRTAQPTT
jgi:hypothetical protein